MFANLTNEMDFQAKALLVRAQRQQVIASNIANIDTPGYVGKDIDFKQAMAEALAPGAGTALAQPSGSGASGGTDARHIALHSTLGSLGAGEAGTLAYTPQTQPSMDGNSVDIDRERANFADNAVRYEATLRFINGYSRTLLSAIQGQ